MTNNWSQDTYIKAYRLAALAHQGQKVTGTEIPYIQHLSFVSMEIIAALSVEKEHDGNLAVQCAILHDTIEDTNTTFEQIKRVVKQVSSIYRYWTIERNQQTLDSTVQSGKLYFVSAIGTKACKVQQTSRDIRRRFT